MEIFDIVDENDNVIGQRTRNECHDNPGLIHRTTQFTLINRSTSLVLFTKRAHTKEFDPGKICFLGEHILAGETYEQATRRGIREELNFESKGKIVEMGHNIFKFPLQTEFVRFFLVDYLRETMDFDKHEISEGFWINLKDIKQEERDCGEITKFWIDTINWGAI